MRRYLSWVGGAGVSPRRDARGLRCAAISGADDACAAPSPAAAAAVADTRTPTPRQLPTNSGGTRRLTSRTACAPQNSTASPGTRVTFVNNDTRGPRR